VLSTSVEKDKTLSLLDPLVNLRDLGKRLSAVSKKHNPKPGYQHLLFLSLPKEQYD